MADESLRQLERRFRSSGLVRDERAWVRARARVGDLTPVQLAVAEYVGLWEQPASSKRGAARRYRFTLGEKGLHTTYFPLETVRADGVIQWQEGRLVGRVTFVEEEHTARVSWELRPSKSGALVGRREELDWSEGTIYEREWIPFTLKRID